MPKKFDIAGQSVEMCVIGEFAKRIGRTSQTIRKWEDLGLIPPSKFRDASGRRVYPKTLVDRVAKLIREEKVVQGVPISQRFKEEVMRIFNEEENALTPEQEQ